MVWTGVNVGYSCAAPEPLTLQGSVDLQGRPPKPAPAWVTPLTLSLTPAGGDTPSHTFPTTTDQNGEFSLDLDGVAPGLYDVRLKGDHTLRSLAPGLDLNGDDVHYAFGTLLEGDVETVTTFNHVTIGDAILLVSSFALCQSVPGFVANADLDQDGCVLITDFGLLSGNLGKSGDIVVAPTITLLADSLPANSSGALLAFSAEEIQVEAGDVFTLTLEIDPNGQPVNGAMVHLGFDPALVEVIEVNLTDQLPFVLLEPVIDNQQGSVRFAAGVLGQTLTEKFTLATLSLKVKEATTGANLTLLDLFGATDVSGPSGSVLGEANGVTLKTEAAAEAENATYLPVIMK
jgi:hypothetical protein